jgi:hypothetical protein
MSMQVTTSGVGAADSFEMSMQVTTSGIGTGRLRPLNPNSAFAEALHDFLLWWSTSRAWQKSALPIL